MFAVLTVHSPISFDPIKVSGKLSRKGNVDEAVSRTRFQQTPEVKQDIIHWDVTQSGAILIFPNGPNALEIHVENSLDSACISLLKQKVEDALQMIGDVAKSEKIKFDKHRIEIWSEDKIIQHGCHESLWKFLKKQFFEKILSHFVLAMVTASCALMYPVKSESSEASNNAALAFVSVLFALCLRTVLEVFTFKKSIKYDEL